MNDQVFRNFHKHCYQITHLFLKGVVQTRMTLQRGPFCKPSTATMKLYRAPATPTAANTMDKNICRGEMISKGQKYFSETSPWLTSSYSQHSFMALMKEVFMSWRRNRVAVLLHLTSVLS